MKPAALFNGIVMSQIVSLCYTNASTPESFDASAMARLHKRSPVHSVERKITGKSDYHREQSLRLPHGLGIKKGRPINHEKKQQKWSTREQVLFNKDHEGMLEQVRHYQVKEFLQSCPKVQQNARAMKQFWDQKAQETAGSRPLFDKHDEEIAMRSAAQRDHRVNNRDEGDYLKYGRRFTAVISDRAEDIKRYEKEAHIKVLRAKQSAQDWQSLSKLKGIDYLQSSLEDFSTPNKNSLKAERQIKPPSKAARAIWGQSARTKISSAGQKRKTRGNIESVADDERMPNLPPRGRAIESQRLQKKMKEAEDQNNWSRWALRAAAAQPNAEQVDRDIEIRHYHDKEQDKRWNQLHWASILYRMGRQRKQAQDARVAQQPQSP